MQMMRCRGDACPQAQPAQAGLDKDRRGVSVMSKRIDAVIRDTFLPMADSLPSMPTCTGFTFTEHDMLCTVIKDILFRDCPNMVASKPLLLDAVSRAYDEAVSGA